MVADSLRHVYVSRLLCTRHPDVWHGLRAVLGARLRTIAGTKDIWCRDYMPVPVGRDRFVQFKYSPDYLRGLPGLRTANAGSLIGLRHCTRSRLVIDGGNVVRRRDTAILTDKVYAENARIPRPAVRRRLRDLLRVRRLVIVPYEPEDLVGHADGMVRFVNDATLLVNDYRTVAPGFGRRLRRALRGLDQVTIPYAPTADTVDGIGSAEGVFINFLDAGDVIVCPTFGRTADNSALRVLGRCFPAARVVPLDCEHLAREGGALNCVTWSPSP